MMEKNQEQKNELKQEEFRRENYEIRKGKFLTIHVKHVSAREL